MFRSVLFAMMCLIGVTQLATAQSVDISTLSKEDQVVHRVSWCREVAVVVKDERDVRPQVRKIFSVYDVLGNRGLFQKPKHMEMWQKVKNDVKAFVLLEELEINSELMDGCVADLTAILKDNYVPFYTYANPNE